MIPLLSCFPRRDSLVDPLTVTAILAIACWIAPLASAAEKSPAAAADAGSGLPGTADLEKIAEEKGKLLARPTPEWLSKPTVEIPDATAADAAAMKPYVEQICGSEVKFKMLPIPDPKGKFDLTFRMGSPATEKGHTADEGPQHEVTIEPFWMEEHEVTWKEYELWASKLDKQAQQSAKNPCPAIVNTVARPTAPYQEMSFGMGKEGTPAICMTQFAAKVYCRWLSAKTGHYYRLPTEAEWEYACRAGTNGAYGFGDDTAKLRDYGSFVNNADEHYHRVMTKKPNAWGLYDMHGNVSEWCVDQYVADFYSRSNSKLVKNPLSPPTKEYGRVVRGGSWDDDPEKCRSATRRASEKDWKKQDPQIPQSIWYLTDATFVGFRVIRPLHVPTPEEAKKYEIDEDQLTAYKEYVIAQANKQ